MRGISGLERPSIQWLFVAAGVALIGLSTATGVALVRARRALELAHAEATQARVERQQFEASLAHERTTRESLNLALGRERQTITAASSVPTLTLSPDRTKSPSGPQVAVPQTSAPVVEVRLLLPPAARRGATATSATYSMTVRNWTTGDVLVIRSGLHQGVVDGQPAVSARIASDVLVPGPYEIILGVASVPPTDIVATYDVSILPHTDS